MHTLLDDIVSKWHLIAVAFEFPTLEVHLAQPILSEPEPFVFQGRVVANLPRAEVTEQSRRFVVHFDVVRAHRVIDESYTTWDDYEQRDSTDVIQVLSRSRFLDQLEAHNGWIFESSTVPRHFRIWTYDAVIDVLAIGEPTVEEAEGE